mmetsp:Transcript_12358/g.18998  ORF Transcript_12358/g.18998 Transcript_12358/m.18998 type:complete len:215 (+) Transcript_12358:351-995(+)
MHLYRNQSGSRGRMGAVPIIPGLTSEHFLLCVKASNISKAQKPGSSCVNDTGSDGSPRSCYYNPPAEKTPVKRIPRLRAATITKGAFCFQWEAKSHGAYTDTNQRVYHRLYAKGNILKRQSVLGLRQWWGFTCHCSCANFTDHAQCQTRNCGETENYVCGHLHAALLSVIDPEGFVIESPLMNNDEYDEFKVDNDSGDKYVYSEKNRVRAAFLV